MKQFIFCALLAITCLTAVAQNKPNEDSLITLMKDDLCEETGKTPVSEYTAENFQMKMGMQMLGIFDKYNNELKQLYGDDYMTNQSKTYEIGKKIGMQMGISCKVFQEILMNNPDMVSAAIGKKTQQKPASPPKDIGTDAPKVEVISVFGKVISFTPGPISYYTIQSEYAIHHDNNKLIKIYWIGKFEGDDELISNPQRIIGKKVVFTVIEQKVYDAKLKMYKKLDAAFSYSDKVADEIIMQAPAN
jgi:hypothetical protein